MAILFPWDEPIYVGTTGADQVDDLLAANPWPFNSTDPVDTTTIGAGPEYPVAFLTGTNADQPDPDGWSPVYFIAYQHTWRVEVHGRFTGVGEGDPVFKLPDVIAPGHRVPIHGTNVDFGTGWRGYIDTDGTVFYMATF